MAEEGKDVDGTMVMPGDVLAISEEFEAGPGTYEEGGKVLASTAGWAKLDANDRIARVDPVNPLIMLNVGDTIIGRVNDIKKALAITEIVKVVGKERTVSNASDGVIHVSKVANRFVDNMDNELRVRDIVRAKVLQLEPSIQLSTQDDGLGVIFAICDGCARRLELKSEGRLYCKECERTFVRKTAKDYGQWSEAYGSQAL